MGPVRDSVTPGRRSEKADGLRGGDVEVLARARVKQKDSARPKGGRRDRVDVGEQAEGACSHEIETGLDAARAHPALLDDDVGQVHLSRGDFEVACALAPRVDERKARLEGGGEYEAGEAGASADVERRSLRGE